MEDNATHGRSAMRYAIMQCDEGSWNWEAGKADTDKLVGWLNCTRWRLTKKKVIQPMVAQTSWEGTRPDWKACANQVIVSSVSILLIARGGIR